MKAFLPLLALLGILQVDASAKRLAPAKVDPVETPEAVISVPHFPNGDRKQNGGVLEAHHPESGELLWRVQVYKTTYQPTLEKDVQDVFIKSLTFDAHHGLLILSDEKERIFVLNLENRKVTRVE